MPRLRFEDTYEPQVDTKSKIVFMGTPEYAKVILEALCSNKYVITGVVCQPDKRQGRGQKLLSPPVALAAKTRNLPLIQPNTLKDESVFEQIRNWQPDYLIVAAYGRIISEKILSLAKKEALNVHASLLPRWRGASPIQHSLLSGDLQTGISIMRVIKKLDAGPIFSMQSIPIEKDDNTVTLTQKLSSLGASLLLDTLDKIEDIKPVEQDETHVTYAHKLDRSFSKIIWNSPALGIHNQVRALKPWPGAQTQIQGQNIKILKTSLTGIPSRENPGTLIHMAPAGWTISTGSENLLVEMVQLEGKKAMSAYDAANGMRLKVGTVLGAV